MTVRELIEVLEECRGSKRVVVRDMTSVIEHDCTVTGWDEEDGNVVLLVDVADGEDLS